MKRMILVLALAVVLCSGAAFAADAPGEKASDFTFPDVNPASPTFGQEITLSEVYAESGVVINFLASWCGYCWRELPILQEMSDNGEARVLGMAADEYGAPKEIVLSLVADKKLTLPILWVEPEQAKELEKHYTYQTLPATYIVLEDGTIANALMGAVKPERLREEVARAFAAEQAAN